MIEAKPEAGGVLEAGFQVKYTPPHGGMPVVFETLTDIDIDADLNLLRPADYDRSQDQLEGSLLVLESEVEVLEIGDPLVLDPGHPERGPLPGAEVGQGQDGAHPAAARGLDLAEAPVGEPADCELLYEGNDQDRADPEQRGRDCGLRDAAPVSPPQGRTSRQAVACKKQEKRESRRGGGPGGEWGVSFAAYRRRQRERDTSLGALCVPDDFA